VGEDKQGGSPATGESGGSAGGSGDGVLGIGKELAGRIRNEYLAGLLLLIGAAIYGAVKTTGGPQWALVGVTVLLLVVVGAVLVFRLMRPAEPPKRRVVDSVALVQAMSKSQKDDVMTCLSRAVSDAATALNVTKGHVRGNVFGVDRERTLRILPEFMVNVDPQSPERTLCCRIGQGSVGRCYQSRLANIAIFKEGWGQDVLPGDEEAKLNRDLKWIVSVPVLPLDDDAAPPIWILNVDGLHDPKREGEVGRALSAVLPYPSIVARIITDGTR